MIARSAALVRSSLLAIRTDNNGLFGIPTPDKVLADRSEAAQHLQRWIDRLGRLDRPDPPVAKFCILWEQASSKILEDVC